jgi:hypothetical protein
MGVNVDWPSRLNDAGYLLPWSEADPPRDTAVYLFRAVERRWQRLGQGQPSPQNLYEMTSLAYDTRRDRLMLHGGGKERDELWAFDVRSERWTKLDPQGATPETCSREAVYLPRQDVMLTCGPDGAIWSYRAEENAWGRTAVSCRATPNQAMVYDEKNDVVLLVTGKDDGRAQVSGMRYRER